MLTTQADNGLDEDEADEDTLLAIYLRGDISDEEAVSLGIEVGSGGDGAPCPKDDCDGTLAPTDDCSLCDECFYSPC